MANWETSSRKHWTEEENEIFLNQLSSYREAVAGRTEAEVTAITKERAEQLREEHLILRYRSLRAIYEHLVYFDDLTAGVLKRYPRKDRKWVGFSPRKDRSQERNRARMPRYYAQYVERN